MTLRGHLTQLQNAGLVCPVPTLQPEVAYLARHALAHDTAGPVN